MLKVYIASPYTKGDVGANVRRQIDAADDLMNMGLLPFAPLMAHFHHMIHPHEYEYWITYDLGWLESCDCLLRLEGESVGADVEVEKAKELGLPIFYSIRELAIKHNLKLRKYLGVVSIQQ